MLREVTTNAQDSNYVINSRDETLPSRTLWRDSIRDTHAPSVGACVFETKAKLQTAVAAWVDDADAAELTYGHIGNWDVSGITDMSGLFGDLSLIHI